MKTIFFRREKKQQTNKQKKFFQNTTRNLYTARHRQFINSEAAWPLLVHDNTGHDEKINSIYLNRDDTEF